MRVLAIHRGMRLGSPDGHQALGLHMARAEIERRAACRMTFAEVREPDAIRAAVRQHEPDAVILIPFWGWHADDAVSLCADISARARLIFVDYYAPANSPHFAVLPHVHSYIKRQILRDRSLYDAPLIGGTPLTDYLHRHMGIDCDGWGFRSRIDPAYAHKVVLGWNLGTCPRYQCLARLTAPLAMANRLRPYELNARLGLSPTSATNEWYQHYRARCVDAVRDLPRQPRTPGFGRVGHRRYYAELLASRTVISPFGWGEVCFRDYEAVAAGCLLLKPSMDHLETEPDIYRAWRTYVPLRWDFSDLAEQMYWIRTHPREVAGIVREAQATLLNYFASHAVAALVSGILNGDQNEAGRLDSGHSARRDEPAAVAAGAQDGR